MYVQLSSSLTNIVNISKRGGFTFRVILMNMDFERVSDDLELVQVNTTAAIYHVLDVKNHPFTLVHKPWNTWRGLK